MQHSIIQGLQDLQCEDSIQNQQANGFQYASLRLLINQEDVGQILAPSDATKVHYKVATEVKKEDTVSAQGIFISTCLIQVDVDGDIVSSPMFKHRVNYKKSDGSRPDYKPFESAPRKEGHDSWEYVASVKVTDLVLVPFDEDGVCLEETYRYQGTPEGFLQAQNAGLNGNGFDFDQTIVSLGFLKNQVDPASFKKEMNKKLNELGARNGLYEVMFWGFASEVLTSSSEARGTESLFVNTNSFSMGVRPYRTSNKKNGISMENRGFKQGRDFANRLVQRQKARNGETPSPLGAPMEAEVDKATKPAPAPAPEPPATKPAPEPEPPATEPEPPATEPEPPATALDEKSAALFKKHKPKAYARFIELGLDKSLDISKGFIKTRLIMAKSEEQAIKRIEDKAANKPTMNEKGGFGETSEATDEFGINSLGNLNGLGEQEDEDLVAERVSVEEIMAGSKESNTSSTSSRGRGRGMNANAKPADAIPQKEVENKLDNLNNG